LKKILVDVDGVLLDWEPAFDAWMAVTAVQNAGMTGLQEGQSLTFDLEAQQNGKQAAVNLQNA